MMTAHHQVAIAWLSPGSYTPRPKQRAENLPTRAATYLELGFVRARGVVAARWAEQRERSIGAAGQGRGGSECPGDGCAVRELPRIERTCRSQRKLTPLTRKTQDSTPLPT